MLSCQRWFLEYRLRLGPLFINLNSCYGIAIIIHYVTQLHHFAVPGRIGVLPKIDKENDTTTTTNNVTLFCIGFLPCSDITEADKTYSFEGSL